MLFGLFFMFFNLHWLDLHNKTCVALVDRRWSINKNQIEKQTFLDLVTVIESAWLLIP